MDSVPVPTGIASPTGVAGSIATGNFATLTASTGIFAAVAIGSGLLLVFAGHLLFQPILFIGGFYFFGICTFVILQNIEFATQTLIGGTNREWVYLGVCLGIAILGGLLMIKFWKLGFFAIGAVLGFCFAMIVLCAFQNLFTSGTGRWVFTAVCTILGGVLIHFFEMPVLVVATAASGSYLVFAGADVFAGTGFLNSTLQVVRGEGQVVVVGASGSWVWMLVGCVVLALIGMAHQFHAVRRDGWKHRGLMHRDSARAGSVGNGYGKP
ncbi:hypothetical protein HDU98_010624 [Podochytrium sp. JEL0797]|nr:hypothetical protein HDU98_010624 [Podochytrium sp. JEL0797]